MDIALCPCGQPQEASPALHAGTCPVWARHHNLTPVLYRVEYRDLTGKETVRFETDDRMEALRKRTCVAVRSDWALISSSV